MVKIELKILKQLSALSFAAVKYLANESHDDNNNTTTANNNNTTTANNNNTTTSNNNNATQANIEEFQATQVGNATSNGEEEEDDEDNLIIGALLNHEVLF